MKHLELAKKLEDATNEGKTTFTFKGTVYTLPTPQKRGTETQKKLFMSAACFGLATKILNNDFEVGFLNIRRAKSGLTVSAFLTYVSNGRHVTVKAQAQGGGYDKTGAAVSKVLNQTPLKNILNDKYSKRVSQTYHHKDEPLEFDVDGHRFELLLNDLGFGTLILQDRKFVAIYKNSF